MFLFDQNFLHPTTENVKFVSERLLYIHIPRRHHDDIFYSRRFSRRTVKCAVKSNRLAINCTIFIGKSCKKKSQVRSTQLISTQLVSMQGKGVTKMQPSKSSLCPNGWVIQRSILTWQYQQLKSRTYDFPLLSFYSSGATPAPSHIITQSPP